MLRTLTGFLCLCFSIPAQAKLGETVPQLVKRFGKSYTVEPVELGKKYKFRSANVSVDAIVANGVSTCETYLSDHPLTANGEPPNDIVRGVLATNVPKGRWIEIDAAQFGADYALRSADDKCIAILKYIAAQPENSVWTMTVGRAEVIRSVSTATPPGPITSPLATQTPTPTGSPAIAVVASATPAPHIDFSPWSWVIFLTVMLAFNYLSLGAQLIGMANFIGVLLCGERAARYGKGHPVLGIAVSLICQVAVATTMAALIIAWARSITNGGGRSSIGLSGCVRSLSDLASIQALEL